MSGPWRTLSPTCSRRAVLRRIGGGFVLFTEYRSAECGRTVVRRLAEQPYATGKAAAAAFTVRLAQVAA